MVAFSLAKKNIVRKQERSLLTIIGVILAVGSFVALLSIAEGLNKKINSEVKSRNVDIYVLPQGSASLPTGPIGGLGASSDDIEVAQMLPDDDMTLPKTETGKPITLEDINNFKKNIRTAPKTKGNFIDYLNSEAGTGDSGDGSPLAKIKSAIGVTRFQKSIRGRNVIFWGIPFGFSDSDNTTIFQSYLPGMKIDNGGQFPIIAEAVNDMYACKNRRTASQLSQQERVFVAGKKIAEELRMSMDKPLNTNREGVSLHLEALLSFDAGFQDYFCYMPIQTAMAIDGSYGKVNEIWIQLEHPTQKDIKELKNALSYYFPDLEFKTSDEYLGTSAEMLKYAWFLEFAIALIGILIAMTASMNTMLMSTFERIREFGALRAIGAGRSTIASMILIESLILSMIGGIAGIIVGILGSIFLDGAVQAVFRMSFPMANITFNLILYALILSGLIGIIGAIFPIVLVYRMEIIKALKWDI
ncbi:MAG: ABC transporter permease [bacterium]|nr:ABC transporter permease [bacterium]